MLLIVMLLLSLGGCGTIYKVGVDPDARLLAKVDGVEGNVLQLNDGRRVAVGGVELPALGSSARLAFEAQLRRLVTVEPMLIREIPNTKLVQVQRSVRRIPTALKESWGIPPFAEVKYVSPGHSDVVEYILGEGLVRADVAGLPDGLKERYVQAQELARLGHRGIWEENGAGATSTRNAP